MPVEQDENTSENSNDKIDQSNIPGWLPKNLKVLVVDDSLTARKAMCEVLTEIGVKGIAEASDGHTAEFLLATNPYDLVVSDWNMPTKSGLELFKMVRNKAKKTKRDMHFIMFTASNTKEDVVEALQAGVMYYIVKPFDVQIVKDKLSKIYKKSFLERIPESFKALIVDESLTSRKTMKEYLNTMGFKNVQESTSAADACKFIKEELPSIAIVDWSTFSENEFKLPKLLDEKARSESQKVPLITVGSIIHKNEATSLDLNIPLFYLKKPFTFDSTKGTLTKLFEDLEF